MKTKQITIEVPEGKNAIWENGVLTLVDEKPQDVKERIKTFEDAINELGDDNKLVKEYLDFMSLSNPSADLSAYFKLRIICAALNEGWEPQFTKDEYRYYPWFCLYTQEELDKDCELKERAVIRPLSGVLFGGAASGGSSAGLAYASSYSAPSAADARFGSRLCFQTRELAKYAGNQFKELYADFCFRQAANQ